MKTPKSLFFVAIAIFCSLNIVNAQKIKVKKDQVLADKAPIAVFEEIGKTYKFANIGEKGNPVFNVDYHYLKISENVSKNWITIYYPDNSKGTEIELEYLSFTLNNKKAISELLFKKYKILTTKGIDRTAFDEFMQVERPSLTDEYNALLKTEVATSSAIANINASVDGDYNRIFKGSVPYTSSSVDDRKRESGEYDNLLGTYTTDEKSSIVSIYDLDKKNVALATVSVFGDVKVILPLKKKEFEYKSKYRFKDSKYAEQDFVRELFGRLNTNGIALGHQVRDERNQQIAAEKVLAKEEFEEAKANSVNIYFTEGYVIDAKEGKKEGEVQFIVEAIQDPEDFKNIIDLDEANIGKRVVLKYKNQKGKTKIKTYKSKARERFCIIKNTEETCFRGLKVKGKGLELAAGAAASLSFDTSSYYVIVKESENFSIYKEYGTERDEFIIKIKSEDKGYKFNTKNREKNIEKLTDYLGSSIDKSELEGLNYANLEDIEKLLELYKK